MRDHLPIARYRKNLLGVRQAIPAILRLFQQYEIHATWAAVGLLFAETREELFASLPANRPQYDDPRLSPYPDLEHLRANEAEEPCYFGASLLRQIAATPHQEIGSHSFSHFYCLEAGASLESFGDDLAAAQRAAAKRGMVLRSFVFPRNQYSAEHVAACADNGFRAMRGTGGNNCYAVFCACSTLTPISAAKTALLFPQTAARRSTISLPAVFSVLMLRVCAPSTRCAGAGSYPPWSSLPSAGWAFICGGIHTILESILSKISRSWERSWRITPSCARSTAWRASAWANSRSDWTLPQWQLRHELRRGHAGWAFSFQHHRL